MEAVASPSKEPNKDDATKIKKSSDKRTVGNQATVSDDKGSNSLKVRANIKLPEIVLFAEPEKFDSKILLLKVEINLDFESKFGDIFLKIHLNDLGIRLGEYNKAQKHGIPFLSPCVLTMIMKQKKGHTLAHYTLNVDNLLFNMTPTLYQVVMGVINTINKSGTETKQIESVKKKLLEDSEPFVIHFDNDAFGVSQKREKDNVSVDEDDDEVVSDKDVTMSINNDDTSIKGLNKLLESLGEISVLY